MEMLSATKCQCGAVTIEAELDDGITQSYSMTETTLEAKLGSQTIAPLLADETYVHCNHCVNNWGVDLCACGSGESPEDCDNELAECGQPMQVLEQRQSTSFWR